MSSVKTHIHIQTDSKGRNSNRGSEGRTWRGSNTDSLQGQSKMTFKFLTVLIPTPFFFFSFHNYVDIKKKKENLKCCFHWHVYKRELIHCRKEDSGIGWGLKIMSLLEKSYWYFWLKKKNSQAAVSVAVLRTVWENLAHLKTWNKRSHLLYLFWGALISSCFSLFFSD